MAYQLTSDVESYLCPNVNYCVSNKTSTFLEFVLYSYLKVSVGFFNDAFNALYVVIINAINRVIIPASKNNIQFIGIR